MTTSALKIAVGIATAGRREILAEATKFLKLQKRLPDFLIVCPLPSDDIDRAMFDQFPAQTTVVCGPTGLCAQRNMILSAALDADIIVFFDDDFLADPEYLANLETIFLANPDITASTGHLLADGANGPGLSVKEGLEILRSARHEYVCEFEKRFGTYGCNMAFRMRPIRANKIRFDENLPLYGWQEDIDFSLRQAPFGRTIKSNRLLGVHLGVKSGRTSGVRFGYSQIANPIYLSQKGTMSRKHARMLMWRNIAANIVRSIYPEPWIDRKGRLKGNLIALADMITSKLSPLRILQLD
jgi:glycosyltransferase involved in cell wall biosynthesis